MCAIDTEGTPERPWSLQFSVRPGEGYLIRATDKVGLGHFRDWLYRARPRIIVHSLMYDSTMCREMGIDLFDGFELGDTQIMAYLLQLEPIGLKPLCSRHCGMVMSSYDDIMGDVGQRLAVDYLTALKEIERADYETRCKEAFWAAIDQGRRITKYPKLPKTALHKAVERVLRSADARKLWGEQAEGVRGDGIRLLGPMPSPSFNYVQPATAVSYGCRDPDGTLRVESQLAPRLGTMGLRGVYALELATYPLIERMSYVGIKPNLRHFATLSQRLQAEIQSLQVSLEAATRTNGFNANSGDQVAAYLFDTLGLESIKQTSGGRGSTNDKILEALEHEHPEYPVISTIREYRELFKLKSTFVDALPGFCDRWPHDGRVHATFRTTRVVTGRLAASDPNLLAMPKHGKFAREFRRGWVPGEGRILCEWDLSQIELRVLAHLSQDPVLLAAFRDGLDLHSRLAQRIFGGTEQDHKKGTTRLAAKAINFGLAMGMTCKGLSVELRKNGVDADEDDAQQWLDETFALYAKVPEYQERMAAEAHANGFVRCLSGRIRYIGGIRSKGPTYEEARRFAFSTPIQEGASWIAKMAQERMWAMLQDYWREGRWVEPLIWMHDAQTMECEEGLAQDLNRRMVQIMTTAPKGFTVPIETSGDWGLNWADMEPFDKE